jgi:hypothetical protein
MIRCRGIESKVISHCAFNTISTRSCAQCHGWYTDSIDYIIPPYKHTFPSLPHKAVVTIVTVIVVVVIAS